MSNVEKMVRIPLYLGQEPLVGRHYAVECTLCGWVGSSEVLTDDCQCTRDVGDRLCLGDADEIGTERLLEIVQAMDRRHGDSQQAYQRLIEQTNETEQYLDKASELLGEIVQSGQTYSECTDKSSATGLRVAAVLGYVAQFQSVPPHTDEDEEARDDNWRMNPCQQGHRDVGASGGVAYCCQCDEKITAASTQKAFEQWNASHPAQPV
ncbi:hypothetical protein [Pseudomonas sp. MWU12-2323]|uniref:hypothetical protein n=1 Tax=Pseudomonas sp. MWU12-2323 TaxID=2651296 RepID=UPI00128B8E18|nr:hypothetical protein [Pseudomonas sp. MWU12-2323]MPQ69474.1 hypothetical protein [Pseudomonas sp. MWU12-2323]